MTNQSIECGTNFNEQKGYCLNDKNVIQPILLYVLIGLWIFLIVVDKSNYVIAFPELSAKNSLVSNILRLIFVIYFLFYWGILERNKTRFVCFVLFISFTILSYVLSNTFFIYDLFFIPLFLVNFLEPKKLSMVFFISILLAIITVSLLNYFNVLHSPIMHYRGDHLRSTFGFMHPNSLGFAVVFLSIGFVIFKKKFILFDLAFLLGAMAFCFYFPNSFTSTYIIGFLAISLLVSKIVELVKLRIDNNLIKNILFYITAVIFLLIIFLVFYQTFTAGLNSIIDKMPGEIKARFEFNRIAYDRYGLSLFGTPMRIILEYQQQIRGINEPYFTVDCAYFFTMIQYGVVNLIAYLTLIIYCIKNSFKNANLFGALLCLTLAVYGVSETVVLSPLCMIVYAYCFYKKDRSCTKIQNVNA